MEPPIPPTQHRIFLNQRRWQDQPITGIAGDLFCSRIWDTRQKQSKMGKRRPAQATKIIELCSQGFTCIHMDLDVALTRNLSPVIDNTHDLTLSRAFTFPEKTARKLGFVGCTGFYIATPSSLPLLKHWAALIEDVIAQGISNSDQEVINHLMEDLDWRQETLTLDNEGFENAITSWNSVGISVLDGLIIKKGLQKHDLAFGYHSPAVPHEFWNIPSDHGIQKWTKGLRHLKSRMFSGFCITEN